MPEPIDDLLAGMLEQLDDLRECMLSLGERPTPARAEDVMALTSLHAAFAEHEVLLRRVMIGTCAPLPSVGIISMARRGIPIRLTAGGVEGEVTLGELAECLDHACEDVDTEDDRNGVMSAVRILRRLEEKADRSAVDTVLGHEQGSSAG